LLGVLLHSQTSFPVGKVEFMTLYPLCFSEFLQAIGEEKLNELVKKQDWKMIKIFKDKFILLLKTYFFTGGMPEVVLRFSKDRDFFLARSIQENILDSYFKDFSKHIPVSDLQKVYQLWNSIPVQLARTNKKFIFNDVSKNATASTFETSLGWLQACGLVHKVSRISKAALPLKGYKKESAFKLFLCDIGLLSAMSVLDTKVLLEGDALFTEYKGALTEQYVCQEMKLFEKAEIAYWTNDSATAEVDFVLQLESNIIPLEVKASTNLKAKSLSVYREKFKPKTEIRTSLADYKKTDRLFDIPLYAIGELREIVKN
jgi:predicted AAA+ superfamily ATPase